LTSFQQGELQTTGNPLDVAIDGDGFLKIQTPRGTRYSRSGRFELNNDRILVNGSGFPVMGRAGEVTLTGKNISIDQDGSIRVDGVTVDQLDVVTLPAPHLLKKEGQTLLSRTSPGRRKTVSQVIRDLESSIQWLKR
jgi:flagellar basal-body rod protein FlgG